MAAGSAPPIGLLVFPLPILMTLSTGTSAGHCVRSPALMSKRTGLRRTVALVQDRLHPPGQEPKQENQSNEQILPMKKRFTSELKVRRPRHRKAPASPDILIGFEQFNLEVPEQFPEKGMVGRAALAVVNSEAWTDANPMLNLSSFVSTFTEPEEMEVLKSHFTKNYIDHDMYPQLFAIERKMVNWLHGLWNGPKNVEPYGTATIGSSEACMLAGLAHKWNWREAREKARKDSSRPNMVTGGNVQIVWKKFLKYFDVEGRIAPLEVGNYRLTTRHLDKLVDENTICVVAIAGQTFTGEDDDIEEIHDWLDAYEKRTGISIPMHIDGASGGFVNPFIYPKYKWDFRLPRVQSINASGHKFGLVPPGLGWIIFRERKIFNKDLIFYVNYLGGESPTATLNFSRNAMQIPAQYYMFLRCGKDGYRRIMQQAVDNAVHLRDQLLKSGHFEIMNETQRIPVVALTLDSKIK